MTAGRGGDRRASTAVPRRTGFDRVVSTLPTALTVRLTPELPASTASATRRPKALGAHCLVLSLDRPLTDVYWIGVNDPDYPFLALVEHTNMLPPDDYGGRHLVYLGNYRPHDDPLFRCPTEEIVTAVRARSSGGSTRPSTVMDPRRLVVRRAVRPAGRHAGLRPDDPAASTRRSAGLFVANMFQVYPHDRGQNYSIELAERLVEHLES